jgi:uncharacterized protein YjbI with pentapeptide repeats
MSKLEERWKTDDGKKLTNEILSRLVAGKPLDSLGLGHHDGRTDLRGLRLPSPDKKQQLRVGNWNVDLLEAVSLSGVSLESLNFDGAYLEGLRFKNAALVNCSFVGAKCQGWRLWESDVRDSNFTRANLRGAAVGTWNEGRGNKWRNVIFSLSDFRVAVSWCALYESCVFTDSKITGVKFEQCSLIDCIFAGVMDEVVFDGRPIGDRPASPAMVRVDFGQAVFGQVEFYGFLLDDVRLPDDIRVIKKYGCVIEHVLANIGDLDSRAALMLRGIFVNHQKMMRGVDEDNIFNERDYEEIGGRDLKQLAIEVIGKAEFGCGDRA